MKIDWASALTTLVIVVIGMAIYDKFVKKFVSNWDEFEPA